jgi:hypothetical protein
MQRVLLDFLERGEALPCYENAQPCDLRRVRRRPGLQPFLTEWVDAPAATDACRYRFRAEGSAVRPHRGFRSSSDVRAHNASPWTLAFTGRGHSAPRWAGLPVPSLADGCRG